MVNTPTRIQDREEFIKAVEGCTGLKLKNIGRPKGRLLGLISRRAVSHLDVGVISLIHWVSETNGILATLFLIKGTPILMDRSMGQLQSSVEPPVAKSWSATL